MRRLLGRRGKYDKGSLQAKIRLLEVKFMPIDGIIKEAAGLPDKYVDMVVRCIHFLQHQLKTEEEKGRSSCKRETRGYEADGEDRS